VSKQRTASDLASELRRLRALVAFQERRLKRLEAIRGLVGHAGEAYLAKVLRLPMPDARTGYDFRLPSGRTLEVKTSKLFKPSKSSSVLRWTWHRPLGWTGQKKYDFLVLLGDKDLRFRYKSRSSEYVIFLIPHKKIGPAFGDGKDGKGIVNLLSNPTTWNKSYFNFAQHEVSLAELKARLGIGPR
jgi:hypothetical protein